jgi:threonine aldolase
MGGPIAGTHALMCHCCLPCLVADHETAAGLGAVPGAELMRPPRPTTIVTRTECTARVAGHGVRVLSPPSGYVHAYAS